MARIHFIIEDISPTHTDMQMLIEEPFPESAILYTNAQSIAKEVERFLRMVSKEVNSKNNQEILVV